MDSNGEVIPEIIENENSTDDKKEKNVNGSVINGYKEHQEGEKYTIKKTKRLIKEQTELKNEKIAQIKKQLEIDTQWINRVDECLIKIDQLFLPDDKS